MSDFSVTILGCGSAKPSLSHYTSAQVVYHRGSLFLVDCGEGVQRTMLMNQISMHRIGHIFLSHLHGDHCLGLVGLISTLGLGQRTGKVVIHAHPDAEKIFQPLFDYFCPQLSMEVEFQSFDYQKSELIYEDKSLEIYTIPLHHRVPCAGFLFKEKPNRRHLLREECDKYNIPEAYFQAICHGRDWELEDGTIIPNTELTTDPTPSYSYAYCSDTIYTESVVPIIKDCDLLYHESTFMHDMQEIAKERGHSTSIEAATIAKKANVGKLVLGHFSSRYTYPLEQNMLAEAKTVFENTILAKEKLVIDITNTIV